MRTLQAILEDRAKCAAAIEELREKFGNDSKAVMTPDEEERFDKAVADWDKFDAEYNRAKKADMIESAEKKVGEAFDSIQKNAAWPDAVGGKQTDGSAQGEAFKTWIRTGERTKAFQLDDPSGGGFALPPLVIHNEIFEILRDLSFIRQLAKVVPLTNSHALGVVTFDTDLTDAEWTAEIGSATEDTTQPFNRRDIQPTWVQKLVKESNALLRFAPEAANQVLSRMAYKFAITEEKAFLTGTGASQPLGVFTASVDGVPTSRDTTSATATTITGDNLWDVKHSLKAAYWPRAQWVMNRTVFAYVRKLKDTTNNYIWASGMGPGGGMNGTPGLLCDCPYHISEYAPGTITSGLYTAVLGDFSRYLIADASSLEIQRADQIYAATNQTGFFGRKCTDGAPILSEAFARLIQA